MASGDDDETLAEEGAAGDDARDGGDGVAGGGGSSTALVTSFQLEVPPPTTVATGGGGVSDTGDGVVVGGRGNAMRCCTSSPVRASRGEEVRARRGGPRYSTVCSVGVELVAIDGAALAVVSSSSDVVDEVERKVMARSPGKDATEAREGVDVHVGGNVPVTGDSGGVYPPLALAPAPLRGAQTGRSRLLTPSYQQRPEGGRLLRRRRRSSWSGRKAKSPSSSVGWLWDSSSFQLAGWPRAQGNPTASAAALLVAAGG